MQTFEQFYAEYCTKHMIPVNSPYRAQLYLNMKEAFEAGWALGYVNGSREARDIVDDPYKM